MFVQSAWSNSIVRSNSYILQMGHYNPFNPQDNIKVSVDGQTYGLTSLVNRGLIAADEAEVIRQRLTVVASDDFLIRRGEFTTVDGEGVGYMVHVTAFTVYY